MPAKLTTDQFIAKSKQIHGDTFDYSKTEYKGAFTNVIIICKIHGQFEQSPDNHYRSKYCCYKCSEERQKRRQTTEEFIEKANKIHGNKYDYSKTNYVHSQTKVIIICKKHGEFRQLVEIHMVSGCPKCAGRNITTEEFISECKNKHGNKYDYSKTVYKTANSKIIIICHKHGEFLQTAESHKSGNGCHECAGNRKSTLEEFITKARNTHGDKYDYSKAVYINGYHKIIIICPTHGEFSQTVNSHLVGRGCPGCSTSRHENICRTILENKFNKPFPKKRPSWLRSPKTNWPMELDGFCQELNIAFEYNGKQHFEVIKHFKMSEDSLNHRKEYDLFKAEKCKENGVILFVINQTSYGKYEIEGIKRQIEEQLLRFGLA